MRSAMERGKWVFFQNCHLAPSWMPSLERLVEQIDPDKVSRYYDRLPTRPIAHSPARPLVRPLVPHSPARPLVRPPSRPPMEQLLLALQQL